MNDKANPTIDGNYADGRYERLESLAVRDYDQCDELKDIDTNDEDEDEPTTYSINKSEVDSASHQTHESSFEIEIGISHNGHRRIRLNRGIIVKKMTAKGVTSKHHEKLRNRLRSQIPLKSQQTAFEIGYQVILMPSRLDKVLDWEWAQLEISDPGTKHPQVYATQAIESHEAARAAWKCAGRDNAGVLHELWSHNSSAKAVERMRHMVDLALS
ncbi:MAG: hypothetical protein MMC23_002943 [Stictis urceolatum]|nr:hypothetical protein [Stictis urceolata]